MKDYLTSKRLFLFILLWATSLVILGIGFGVLAEKSMEQNNTDIIGDKILVAKIEGVIDPATEEFIDNVITQAENTHSMVILLLNTPGGLLDSAMNIVIRIDNSQVPVVGFVVDKWAESAGTLILVTTHVAAMQPGTIIGSVQPIQYDPTRGTYQPINESKIINPLLEFLDEHAGNKGRNITIIKKFVTENLNLGAYDALKYGVIEYVAKDVYDLIRQMNGTVVTLPLTEKSYLVITDNASVEYVEQPLRLKFAHALSDPMLTSLFMTLGLTIILFSILSGHLTVTPIGILLLLLGLIGSGYDINITTTFLLLLGVVLLGVELFVTPGFGVIGITGIIMLAVGIALLPVSGGYSFSIEYARSFIYAAYSIGGILGALTGITVYKVIQAKRRKPFSWNLEGAEGRATDPITPKKEGFIIVNGEYWRAKSLEGEIKPGDKVVVIRKEGPILTVKKKEVRETKS